VNDLLLILMLSYAPSAGQSGFGGAAEAFVGQVHSEEGEEGKWGDKLLPTVPSASCLISSGTPGEMMVI